MYFYRKKIYVLIKNYTTISLFTFFRHLTWNKNIPHHPLIRYQFVQSPVSCFCNLCIHIVLSKTVLLADSYIVLFCILKLCTCTASFPILLGEQLPLHWKLDGHQRLVSQPNWQGSIFGIHPDTLSFHKIAV